MQFDVILTNPPFQDTTKRGKTPHKLWIDFTLRSWELLKDGGVLCQVSPASFRSPNSKILGLMREHHTPLIRFNTDRYFPGVGSSFSDYAIIKGPPRAHTFIQGQPVDLTTVAYLPNDTDPLALGIHQKVMFDTTDKLPVEHDYVTCHNSLVKHDTLRKEKTDLHIHPVLHTNRQIWWSTNRQEFAGARKVMWSRSGYTQPRYDPGRLGCTDMGYFVRVESDADGEWLVHNLTSKLFRYIFTTAKWSGFGNERVFAMLPNLPRVALTDKQVYDLFGLSQVERSHVELFLA